MKNLFLLPTSEATRLWVNNLKRRLELDEFPSKHSSFIGKHIYITSDEQPKDGDYILIEGGEAIDYNKKFTFPTKIWKRINNDYFTLKGEFCFYDNENDLKKIILTTDLDLIKDGVQAIQAFDDEFLEWFVKNPTCEFVKVEHFGTCCGNQSINQCINCKKYNPVYKIIIPQEEPKQELEKELFELEQELDIPSSMRWHNSKPKQETLEEYLQICKDCGSKEVARCKWVNVNTEEIYSTDSGTNLEWCFNCKSETNIINKEDYKTKIQ
jgi:hypothetical protein